MSEVMATVGSITKPAEQKSVRAGLERLEEWRAANPTALRSFRPATYESPNKVFRVAFTPDFGQRIEGHLTAIHIWNTADPKLNARIVYGALALFPAIYASFEDGPDDLAVLSLREPTLFRLREAESHLGLGQMLVLQLEELFAEVRDELGLPPRDERPDALSPF